MEDDGYYLPEIRPHSLEKIRRHDFYADVFTRAMHRKYRHLVYIGLYSGAGKAVVRGTSEIVETSALAVIRQTVPFTSYIFIDSDRRCTEALDHRINALGGGFDVTLIQRPFNDAVPDILAALPDIPTARREGLLGLCFANPFKVDLDFNVIRALSRYRLDFLVTLPFGFDLRRNLHRHLENEADTSVARLLTRARGGISRREPSP